MSRMLRGHLSKVTQSCGGGMRRTGTLSALAKPVTQSSVVSALASTGHVLQRTTPAHLAVSPLSLCLSAQSANSFSLHRLQACASMHTSNTGLLARHMSSSQESRRFRWDGSGGSGEDFSSSSSSSSWYLLWWRRALLGPRQVISTICFGARGMRCPVLMWCMVRPVASSNGVPAATQTEQTSSKAEEDQPVPIPELQGKKDLYNGMRVLVPSFPMRCPVLTLLCDVRYRPTSLLCHVRCMGHCSTCAMRCPVLT
eukprot:3306886-Rhodomonas_salina.2